MRKDTVSLLWTQMMAKVLIKDMTKDMMSLLLILVKILLIDKFMLILETVHLLRTKVFLLSNR